MYSSTFTSEPSRADLLGALSLIIWTLTLIVTIKYVFIVLRADDQGQGGTFAVYSLLSRYVSKAKAISFNLLLAEVSHLQAHIVRRDPREEMTIKMERAKTSDLNTSSKSTRSFIERSALTKALLKVVGVAGVSLVMSGTLIQRRRLNPSKLTTFPDGVLTPAQSVLGAIQG